MKYFSYDQLNSLLKKQATTNRRQFLTMVAGVTLAGSTLLNANQVEAAVTIESDVARSLKFYNTHTYQELELTYRIGDKYHKKNLMRLNYLLRDHRQNEAAVMDVKLFDQLWELQHKIGGNGTFQVISGYRSPKTNKLLRKTTTGVAKRSYHMQGRAIDIRLTGTPIKVVRKTAVKLRAGGVGYYPSSDFVHLDTGPVRNWASS